MPTLGWILETAEERFYERGGDGMASHVPAKVKCPICDAEFDDLLALSWHVSDLHPLERPLLLIGGAAIPSSAVFSVQPDPAVIAFANTTTIRATCNGRAINAPAPEDLAARLGSERRAVFHIELENSRAQDEAKVAASYTILTAVPEEADLTAVDQLFAQHLAVDAPTVSDVRVFADSAGRYSSADRYTNGLAEYVLAILAKEGNAAAGTTLPFEAFQMKIQQALAGLAPHQARPLPQAVCAAARLNINDVRRGYPAVGNPTLDGILQLLQRLGNNEPVSDQPEPADDPALAPICPIDRDTHLILRAYDDLYRRQIRSQTTAFAEYAARAEDATLSAFDRTKLRVMLAARLLGGGQPSIAAVHLNELIYDPLFGRWAVSCLELIERT